MMTASGSLSGVTLTTLLHGLGSELPDVFVQGIKLDSRAIKRDDLFIAVSGNQCHGLCYLDQAIIMGAAAVVYDPLGVDSLTLVQALAACPVPIVALSDLNEKIGEIAARFYQHPSKHLKVIGITGTNGKTSCSHYIAQALTEIKPAAVIGTLGWGLLGQLQATNNTTPNAVELQKYLNALLDNDINIVAMEVSSHGLVQGRTNGTAMVGALYTNISRDHLDYHGNIDAYLSAKLTLLQAPGLGFVVVNLDDPYTQQIIAQVPDSVRIIGFSRQPNIEASDHRAIETVMARQIRQQSSSLFFEAHYQSSSSPVSTGLLGDFNVENLLASVAVIIGMGYSLVEATRLLSKVRAVPGRMECFSSGSHEPQVIVDYAHTPAALENVLRSAKALTQGRLWVVFGCGGNRDAGKRAEMGQVAEAIADHTILTDDNPRYEPGEIIIADIQSGCTHSHQISICFDREQAIISTIQQATSGDIVVIAGKGHELTQDIKGVLHPFSDQQVVRKALLQRKPAKGEQG